MSDLLADVVRNLGSDVHVEIEEDAMVRGDAERLVQAFMNLASVGLLPGAVRFRSSVVDLDEAASRRCWVSAGPYIAVSLHDGSSMPCRTHLAEPTGPGERDLSVAAGILRAHEGYLMADVTPTGTAILVYLPIG
jgi:nitrogen-specific signal transduction histidine kinase